MTKLLRVAFFALFLVPLVAPLRLVGPVLAFAPWMPEVDHPYAITLNGLPHSVTLAKVEAVYLLPAGYRPCRVPLRCVDNSLLSTCTAGVEAATCDAAGDRITYTTPSHRARVTRFNENHTVIPATIRATSAEWLQENEAQAVGSSIGGPAGGFPDAVAVDAIDLGDGNWLVDFQDAFGFYSVFVPAGGFT